MYHFELWFSLGVCLGVELDHGVGHIVFLFVVFKGAPTLFSAVVVPSLFKWIWALQATLCSRRKTTDADAQGERAEFFLKILSL